MEQQLLLPMPLRQLLSLHYKAVTAMSSIYGLTQQLQGLSCIRWFGFAAAKQAREEAYCGLSNFCSPEDPQGHGHTCRGRSQRLKFTTFTIAFEEIRTCADLS